MSVHTSPMGLVLPPPAKDADGAVTVLHPGDVALGQRGDRMATLLGSCVSVILIDPRRTVGVMSHIVHAKTGAAQRADSKHGDAALQRMARLLRGQGIEPRLCEAYVYGGGNMFPGLFPQAHVGASNARWALDALAELGIRVLQHDLGGSTYRRLSWTVGPALPSVVAVQV